MRLLTHVLLLPFENHTNQRHTATLMCVTPRPVQFNYVLIEAKTPNKFKYKWTFCGGNYMELHTREDHVIAPQPMGSAKQALPGHQKAQWSSNTCDDDLGDIQNGAEWRSFTMASFILGACCKNTHIQLRTQQACRCRREPTVGQKCGPQTCRAYNVRARAACATSFKTLCCGAAPAFLTQTTAEAAWIKSSTRQFMNRQQIRLHIHVSLKNCINKNCGKIKPCVGAVEFQFH